MIKLPLFKREYFTIGGLLILVLLISGCAALVTITIQKANNLNSYEINKLGYSQLASEEILNSIKSNTSIIYQSNVEEFFSNESIVAEKYTLSKFESIDTIAVSEIVELCQKNDLDCYLCTQIKYKFALYFYMFIPLGKSEDVIVDMKLFDKQGVLMLHTMHSTSAGNSYMMPPKAKKTVRDGTLGALKQIMKEIEQSKIPEK